jgi:hypothetical protein
MNIGRLPAYLLGDVICFEALASLDCSQPGIAEIAEVSPIDAGLTKWDARQPSVFSVATIQLAAIGGGAAGFPMVGAIRVDDPLAGNLPIPGTPGVTRWACGVPDTSGSLVLSPTSDY